MSQPRRQWRKTVADTCPAFFLAQQRAMAVISEACRLGILLRAYQRTCVDCGAHAQVYDHRDYSKPYEVDPVCQVCNLKRGRAKWRIPPEVVITKNGRRIPWAAA